ncbi:MAG: aminopeptidase P family N-terminal domain-containing protein [Pirellulales bacterium]
MTDLLDLSVPHCRERQKRLLRTMAELRLDWVALATHENTQWLTGHRCNWHHEPFAALRADGTTLLIAPNKPPAASAADDVRTYEANSVSTLRNDQRQKSSAVLVDAIRSSARMAASGSSFLARRGI